jgi:hypothetical protein
MAHNSAYWCSADVDCTTGDFCRFRSLLRNEPGGLIHVFEALYLVLAISLGLKLAATTSPTINRFQVAKGRSQLVVITH